MKKNIAFLLLSICSLSCFSQRIISINENTRYIDSLISVVKKTKSDSIKSIISFELVRLFVKHNEVKKIDQYLKIGNKYAINYPYLRDCSGYYNALKFLTKNDLDSFKSEISKTLKKLKKYHFYHSYELQTLILQNLSSYYQIKGNKEKAMRILVDEAIPVTLKVGNKIMLANLYKMIATNMISISNREKADEYYKKSLEVLENEKSKGPFFLETIIEVNIAAGDNLLALNRLKDGRKFLNNAFLHLKKYPNSNINVLYYCSEGNYYSKIKQYEKALYYYEKGILINGKLKDTYLSDLNNLKLGKYEALYSQKKYLQAKIVLSDIINNGNLSQNKKNNYILKLSNTFEKLEDYKNALFYSKEYIKTNESIIKINTNEEVLRLEAKYKNYENQARIKQLKAQKDKAELSAQNNNLKYYVFGLLSIALLLAILFIYFYFKNKQKLSIANDYKNRQELNSLKAQKEVEVMQAMIDGEEAERKRIARDLHDGIGSRLSSLKMQLNNMQSNADNGENLKIISNSLSISINELRQTSFNLVPETLLKLGLELALKDLCFSMSNNQVSIAFQSNEIQSSITETNQISIFRIVQELINNSLKHSNCSQIIVDCSQNENLFLITVEDDGIGFNTGDIEFFTGLGLKNLKNRVDLLKGKLDIRSNTNRGTTFNIELQIQTRNE